MLPLTVKLIGASENAPAERKINGPWLKKSIWIYGAP
jgi:hypothetical protein